MKSRQVNFSYEKLSSNGRAKIQGNSLQRAPGYGGSTFAIALVPDNRDKESISVSEDGPQFIAFQRDMWRLGQQGSKLHLEINGIYLAAPAPPAGIFSGSFKDPIDAQMNSTFIGQNEDGNGQFQGVLGRPLIVNERLVADEQDDRKIDNSISSTEGDLCVQLALSERL